MAGMTPLKSSFGGYDRWANFFDAAHAKREANYMHSLQQKEDDRAAA